MLPRLSNIELVSHPRAAERHDVMNALNRTSVDDLDPRRRADGERAASAGARVTWSSVQASLLDFIRHVGDVSA